MPRVEPLPLDGIDPSLASAIEQAKAKKVLSSTLPVQIWAHRPDTAMPWVATLDSFYSDSLLGERTKELVRLKIASITRCDTCQLARKSDTVSEHDIACLIDDSDPFSPDVQAALGFAELFASDYTAIDDAIFAELRAHFSTEAIVELNLFCALMLAGGRLTYVLNGYENES